MSKQSMTLEEIAGMDCPMLTPAQAAAVTGSSPYYIRVMAQTTEGRAGLGFPVMRVGRYTKIPRIPFLRFMGWEGAINGATEGGHP